MMTKAENHRKLRIYEDDCRSVENLFGFIINLLTDDFSILNMIFFEMIMSLLKLYDY